MARKIGRLINIGLGKEVTRGTAVAATYWLPKSTMSFFDKATKAVSQMNYGNIGDGNQELVALKWADGTIETDLQSKSFGLILLATFGTLSSGSFSSAYKHTYTLQNDNAHDSLTLWYRDSAEPLNYFFEMAMIDALTIKATPEDVVKATIKFTSKSSEDTGTLTPAYVAEDKFVGRHVNLKLASLASGLTAASKIYPKNFEITFTKNILRDHVLSTVQPYDIVNQKFEITGSFEIDKGDATYRNLMLNGTYNAMRLDIVNTDVTVGATNPAFRIDLSRCSFDSWEVKEENDAVVTQKINFRALYDITNGNIINDCYLVNAVASY